MAKRTFLTLAHKYVPGKCHIGGWFYSEKLDGMRCFWDGGITRGHTKDTVPWANTAKDGRYVTPPVATGLWSRYGNVIHAPDWWLNLLPAIPLDGELYMQDYRQHLMSTVKKLTPVDDDWEFVEYKVFDLPPLDVVLAPGVIDIPNYHVRIGDYPAWLIANMCDLTYLPKATTPFWTTVKLMQIHVPSLMHAQYKLPYPQDKAEATVIDRAQAVKEAGGEGLILKAEGVRYKTERSHSTVKVKPNDDAEGTVIGYTSGKETDKGSKLLGMMGALILKLDNGHQLHLSGFTDAERTLNTSMWASEHPGERCPSGVHAVHFPMGSRVTFTYRGVSEDGIPQEARYWRKYDAV